METLSQVVAPHQITDPAKFGKSRQVVIEVERPRVVCGRREWFVVRLSFPSEHRAHIRARQLAREPEARTVRVVISEPDGHVSRYTYKSRFPRVRAFDIAS